jgi:PAS domain S-box-containing protein
MVTNMAASPPLTLQSIPAASGRNGTDADVAALKANILIVDDRPDKLLALKSVLEALGENILEARSGKDALRVLLKDEVAVILMDVAMPGMDGFETASLIRQRPSTSLTPIIFITSINSSDNHIARGYSLHAVDYLLSPIVPEILRTKVCVLVDLYKKTELIKRQAEQLRSIEETRHKRELAEVSDRLEIETRRNRFFTLAPDLLGIARLDGHLVQLNPSWTRVLGYQPEELSALSGFDLVHPDDLGSLMDHLANLKNSASHVQSEARFRHKDGSYRWLRWVVAPFPQERLIYIFAQDITARKAAEAEINHLNHELSQQIAALTAANRELEAFNYSIAHDLRTPLRSMSGFSRALLEDESANLSSLGVEYARRIAQSAKYMDSLLLDLLAYSRLARAELNPTLVSLDDPVRELLVLVDKEIQEREVKVEVSSPLGNVYAHLPTLKQVVSNLISNSLKFTAPERPAFIRIFTTRRDGFVRLFVEDNGIGIPQEHHEKIFGLFQRLHDTQIYPGTGIGLALVRKGAERMGGSAGVESEPGKGSRFWVDLPSNYIGAEHGTNNTVR